MTVPEMLDDLTVSRQGLFLRSNFIAQTACKFFPDLDIPKYRERFDDAQKDELGKRAMTLERHAAQDRIDQASESSWEADVRSDIFGKIREDSRLRM